MRAAQAAGNWLEAFNFVELGGAKTTYTVKRLEPGAQHAFIVATIPGYTYSDWVFLTTTAASTPTPAPAPASTPTNANCLPIQSVGTYSGTGDSTDTVIQLNAGLYRFTTVRQNTEGNVFVDIVNIDNGDDESVGIYGNGDTGGEELETIYDNDRSWLPQAGRYILQVDTSRDFNDWTVQIELIQAH